MTDVETLSPHGAICEDCGQPMLTASSCIPNVLVIGGEGYTRTRNREAGPDGRCGDCGTSTGGVHHLGCDLERCPRCHQQLITCGCLDGGWSFG